MHYINSDINHKQEVKKTADITSRSVDLNIIS